MKLMLTPTSGVPSEVTTCPRMTQAWLHGRKSNTVIMVIYLQKSKEKTKIHGWMLSKVNTVYKKANRHNRSRPHLHLLGSLQRFLYPE